MISPVCRAAVAVLSLNVDPGMYRPSMARLRRGSLLAGSDSDAYSAWVMPPTQTDGS